MPADVRRVDTRERISRAAVALRHLARDDSLGAVVVALSSVARGRLDAEREDFGQGDPSRLVGLGKESGDIEYAADALADLYRPWQASTSPAAASIAIAEATWRDFRARAAPEEARRPAALALCVVEVLAPVLRAGSCDKSNPGTLDQRPVHAQVPAVDVALAQGSMWSLAPLNAQRVLRFEVERAWQQERAGHPRPHEIVLRGGFTALAAEIGCTGRQAVEDVRRAALAQAHLVFKLPGGFAGNLLSYRHRRACGEGRAELVLSLGDPLLPGYVDRLRGPGRSERRARKLVPLPPFVGRCNEHGAQAAYQLRLVTEMRVRAREIVEQGGVRLESELLAQLAEDVGLSHSLVGRVTERWLRDGDDGPALLERVEAHRYTLGPAHAEAREFLRVGGEDEIRGREAARAGRRQRRGRWRGADR